jgi:hypothetical protein
VRGAVPVKAMSTIAADEGEAEPQNTGAGRPLEKFKFIAIPQYWSNCSQIASIQKSVKRLNAESRRERHRAYGEPD